MSKPAGDEPSSSTSKSLPSLPNRQQELFTFTFDAAIDTPNARTRLEHALVAQQQRIAERAARDAAREAQIAQLQSEVAKLQAVNRHLQKQNDSLREEVLHHRHAVGYYEE